MVIALSIFSPLIGAFVTVWLSKGRPVASLVVTRLFLLFGLASSLALSIQLHAWNMLELGRSAVLHTGVMSPPFSIDLEVTAMGSIAAVIMYVGAIIGAGRLSERNPKTQPLLLALVTASLGLIHSTDLFNSFVFLEIGSIVTIGLTAGCKCRRRWEVAVKVALVSGLMTILYLLAVLVVYRSTGELRLSALRAMAGPGALLVSGLLITVIMTETKAFPLSGWGLDLYQGAGPGLVGVYTVTWSLAMLLWAAKVLPMLPVSSSPMIWIGASGLLLGQLAGLRSRDPGRNMGYSSAAFASLLMVLAGTTGGNTYLQLALVLLMFSSLSKFTIFMMTDTSADSPWSGVSGSMILLPLLTIIGVPPLPIFWAKLRLLTELAGKSQLLLLMVMAGLLLEAVYLLRLWSQRLKEVPIRRKRIHWVLPMLMIIAGFLWITAGWWKSFDLSGSLMSNSTLRWMMTAIFASGTLLCLPGALGRNRRGYWIWLAVSGMALTLLPFSGNSITFYVFWEISAFASVIAVSRGRDPGDGTSGSGTFWFSVFAMTAGMLLLASIVISGGPLASPGIPLVLAVTAALIKMGQMGTHLWTVRAYSAAPGTLAAFLSGTSSKAAVLLLAMIITTSGNSLAVLGTAVIWIGVATALGMAVMAALEFDYKRVLAYASVSQLGYILVGLGLASHLGWTAAMYHTLHHFLFKSVLFLGAAGVIMRTGTSDYNRLGGLVRRMPLTFAFTLVSVIAFAGVPPLAGFGGKWLLYNALIEAGMLPVALVAMFASVVAFLYAFRLLYAVFLGQLSRENSTVREAPLAVLIPQGLLTAAVMVLSFRPTIFLERILPGIRSVQGLSGSMPSIDGTMVTTFAGSWDAWSVGLMVCGLFGFAFLFYWLSGKRPVHVGQLDIGFAGELPPSPEEIHYAGQFYRPYRRALAFLPRIHAGKIASGIFRLVYTLGDGMRSIFTGDARTYLAHSLIFLVVLLFILRGGPA